jgi:hypothetical protein
VPPAGSEATLTELTCQVASYATDTPTQTGTARKATVAATGLYAAPDGGTLYNVGQAIPRLPGGRVFVRGLSDYYTDRNVLWAGSLAIDGTPGVVPDPPVTAALASQGLEEVYHVEEDSSFTINEYLPPGPNWYFSRSFELKGNSICTVPVNIDAVRERVVVLNAAAASVWTRLGADDELVARHGAFLTALRRHGMLQNRPAAAIALPRIPLPPGDTPEILATAPLQVAANNSGDPFASSW